MLNDTTKIGLGLMLVAGLWILATCYVWPGILDGSGWYMGKGLLTVLFGWCVGIAFVLLGLVVTVIGFFEP